MDIVEINEIDEINNINFLNKIKEERIMELEKELNMFKIINDEILKMEYELDYDLYLENNSSRLKKMKKIEEELAELKDNLYNEKHEVTE